MGRWRIAVRELTSIRREKTIVLALVIQLFIAGFSSFLLVGLVSLYAPGEVAGSGVTMGVAGGHGEELAVGIEGEGNWEVVRYDSEDSARDAFDRGLTDAVLLAESTGEGAVFVEALVPDESVRSTVIVVQIREALKIYEREQRAALSHRLSREPVSVPDVPSVPPTFAFTYTVLLPLLMFLPVFISGSVAADSITEEIDRGTLELLRVAPVSAVQIVDGKMFAMILLAPLQAVAWLGLLAVNGTSIANVLPIVTIVAACAVVVVGLGASLAIVFKNRQSAQLVYSLGVVVVFSVASLFPQPPTNTIARFAIDSPTGMSYGLLPVYVVAAIGAYVVVRVFVTRSIAE